MQKKIVSSGYRIKFTTWENDGDDYQVNIIEGLQSSEDVLFLVELGSCFRSRYGRRVQATRTLGNDDYTNEFLSELIDSQLELHPLISKELKERWTFAEDELEYIIDVLYEVLGYPVGYEYGFCRVMETIEVEQIDEDIFVEDVTSMFVTS